MKKISICIPTYNEAENIISLLDKIRSEVSIISEYQFEAVIIDDNSPDKTANIVEEYKKNNPDFMIKIIVNPGKGGLGKAYITGFNYAISSDAHAVMMMDADHSHDPVYIKDIVGKLTDYDFVVGSRYSKGGGVVNWDFRRKMISMFGNLYSRFILGIGITDLTGGFNCYKKEVLEAVNLSTVRSNGYSFQIEIKYKAAKEGYKYTETPIIFKDREFGKSKFDGKIFREAVLTPWKLKLGII